jgi:predicted metalloprotease with PDZ domain
VLSVSPLRVHLDLQATTSHLVDVAITFMPQCRELAFSLPAWTPGSYLIRDYVRQLEGLTALQAERQLALRRTGVAAWAVRLEELEPVTLRYRVLAAELSVRTCHLTDEHAFLCLAAVVMAVDGQRWLPHRLTLALPSGWQAFVPLPASKDGSWQAIGFDQLIDSPVEAGPHPSATFLVAGVPHRWVTWGSTVTGLDPLEADTALLADVQRVCEQCCRVMGETAPAADDYLFVLHLTDDGYGGLEHDRSSVLQFGRRKLAQPDGRRRLLQLVAHEYLHQWNVRRLRPAELSPYTYDQPTVIPSLWFAEGITSYLDQLIPCAAGMIAAADLYTDLAADLSRFRLTPGRAVQSLRQSSEEAWVKLYKADAYAANAQVSYYLKGAVLALVLDLHLRRQGSALVRVLRNLWRSHGRWGRGYREQDLIEAFAAEAADLRELLPRWLDSPEDPDVEGYLADLGLQLVPAPGRGCAMGWQLAQQSGGLQLTRLIRHGPAEQAGLMVGDELIAIAGQRLRDADAVQSLLPVLPAGQLLEVAYCRDGRLRFTSLNPGVASPQSWTLTEDAQASEGCLTRRRQWLSLEVA